MSEHPAPTDQGAARGIVLLDPKPFGKELCGFATLAGVSRSLLNGH